MVKKSKEKFITQSELMNKYGFTRSMIDRLLPKPIYRKNPYYSSASPMRLFRESDILKVIEENPDLKNKLDAKRAKKEEKNRRAKQKAKDADSFLKQFSPDDLIEQGKKLNRHFILHIGPTNSGKTYEALQALKKAESGLYLGPLRLLALEMYETLNQEGIYCNLLTGEEFEEVPGAQITSSTIELCDFDNSYDVVIIDEAQLISDPYRGASWTSAICLCDAREIHICMAKEAESIIISLIKDMNSSYEVIYHERLVPLVYSGRFTDLRNTMDGDCLIAFSRKKVLSISASLLKLGINSSVIYGALPPKARREETRKFASKETRVVVATDAIGMGISLPIKRIIFVDTEKFDGTDKRDLKSSEIKQISGRAGRYGKYDLGEVLTMNNPRLIKEGLECEIEEIDKIQIAFPKEALSYDYPLDKLLKQWDELPKAKLYSRQDMSSAEYLLNMLRHFIKNVDKELVYSLITCPIDIKNDKLVNYWMNCAISIISKIDVEKPDFNEYTLESCELKYQAYDVYHQLLRRIGIEDDCLSDKERLCNKINKLLVKQKIDYLRHCKICGKDLPINSRYNICDDCFKKRTFYDNY